MSTEVRSAQASQGMDGASAALGGASVQLGRDPLRVAGGLSLVLALIAIAWFFLLLVRDVDAANFTRLQSSAVRVDVGPGWVDPRWQPWTIAALAQLPEMTADSPETRAVLERTLAELPFVAEVGQTRVLWPDGVRIDVRFRQPVACVRVGEAYLTLGDDGIVLPGLWSMPPARETGFVPLLACDPQGRAELAEGARVASPALLDGLAVANALWEHLSKEDWFALGRFVIDARTARLASDVEPGTVMWLEGARRIYFGRSPNLDAPGELPYARKCASISAALVKLAPSETQFDWELADVRWDKPELLPRGGLEDDPPAKPRRK